MVALTDVDPALRTFFVDLITSIQSKADEIDASLFGMLPDGTEVLAVEAIHQEQGSCHAKAYLRWLQGGVGTYHVLTLSHCKNGRFVSNFYPGSSRDLWPDGFQTTLAEVDRFNEAGHTSHSDGVVNE